MKERISAIIIDDEFEARELLSRIIADDFKEIEIKGMASNVDQGLELVIKQKPDIIFLDIQMPKKNGFELLHELQKLDIYPSIIFTTAYDEYAIEAIRHSAFDYLQKPIKLDDLTKTISRYKKENNPDEFKKQSQVILDYFHKPRIKFNTRSGFVLVDPKDVLYCLADGNYTDINMVNEQEITVSYNLSSVQKIFNNPNFVRCGRSCIINSQYLQSVNRKRRICTFSVNMKEKTIILTKQGIRDLEKYWNSFD